MTVQELSPEAREALTDLFLRGVVRGKVSPALAEVIDAGLALAKGPIVMSASAAAPIVGGWLRITGEDEQAALTTAFHRFLPLNRQLRELCTAWQCLPGGGVNDHSDAAYDAGIRDRFDDVHDAVRPVLRRASGTSADFEPYAEGLRVALDKFDAGEPQWLASPVCDSYHTVWMHIHQLFLLRLGVSRAEDEALEEQRVLGGAA